MSVRRPMPIDAWQQSHACCTLSKDRRAGRPMNKPRCLFSETRWPLLAARGKLSPAAQAGQLASNSAIGTGEAGQRNAQQQQQVTCDRIPFHFATLFAQLRTVAPECWASNEEAGRTRALRFERRYLGTALTTGRSCSHSHLTPFRPWTVLGGRTKGALTVRNLANHRGSQHTISDARRPPGHAQIFPEAFAFSSTKIAVAGTIGRWDKNGFLALPGF